MHCFFDCSAHSEAVASLVHCVRAYDSELSQSRCLRLDVRACDPFTLPVVVMLATGISLVRSNRRVKSVTTVWSLRAKIEAKL